MSLAHPRMHRSPHRTLRQTAAAAAALAVLTAGLAPALPGAAAENDAGFRIVGDLQSELGCDGDWLPDCAEGALVPTEVEGVFAATFDLPGATYGFKVVNGDNWDAPTWGAGGDSAPGADNIALHLAGEATLTFSFDANTGRVSIAPAADAAEPTETDAPAPVRQAGGDEQFYFVMTDRFANGDLRNDDAGLGADPLVSGFDPTDKGFYHGGDIAGLIDNLDYIEGLGTSAIWLTPSFKNMPVQGEGADASAGYHGYWITDFTQIDPHLGTNAELRTLLDQAHDRGIKVYFDIITNHTADVIDYVEGVEADYKYVSLADAPYTDADGNEFNPAAHAGKSTFPELGAETSFPYTPVIADEDANLKVPSWLNDPTLYHNRGNAPFEDKVESDTYGDFGGLDDLMTEHPTVVNGFVKVYQDWIDFGIDGFRIDTVKHVNREFWQDWTTQVLDYAHTKGKDDFFMFGEVYNADPTKLSPYVRTTDMNSVLDFTFQARARSFAEGGSVQGLSSLFAGDDYYATPDKNAHALPTFLGNHDMGRIGFFVKDSSDALKRSELAHSLMYLTRGQPVVYYGDEQGFTGTGGGDDKDARQSLFESQVPEYRNQNLLNGNSAAGEQFNTDSELYTHIAELAELRTTHPALSDGAQIEQFASAGTGIYAFSRVDAQAADPVEYVVAVNNATSEQNAEFTALTPNAEFAAIHGDHAKTTSGGDGSLSVTVPALSAVVLRAKSAIGADDAPIAPEFVSPTAGLGLSGLAEIAVDLGSERYVETSISYRIAGASHWTLLSTLDTGTPRVFHDVTGLPKGAVIEYRAVARDAADNLTVTHTYASVGDDHGSGVPPEQDLSQRLTIPGSHGTAIGCEDWQPGCAGSELEQRGDGLYEGTFTIPAMSYSYKYAFGANWDNNYGVGGVHNSAEGNYAYTHAGGAITFFFDPLTKLGANTAGGPVVTFAGDFQTQLGCVDDGGDVNWSDRCLAAQGEKNADGIYEWTTSDIAPGSYEVKAIENLNWDNSFGDAAGANVPFTVTTDEPSVTFSYDPGTGIVTVDAAEAPEQPGTPKPDEPRDITVSIAGSFGSALGCGDWDAECVSAELTERVGVVFSQSFDLPAGDHEYKAVIDHAWSENYGTDRNHDGPNIEFTLDEPTTVTFVYSDDSKFVTHFFEGSDQGRIAVVASDIQSHLGCAGDWQPDCLGSWLQNYDRDGHIYLLETNRLPAGTYEAKAAFGSWDEAYPGGNVKFTVETDWQPIIFRFDAETEEFTIQADNSVPGDGERAYWLNSHTLALPASALGDRTAADRTWTLHGAPTGGLDVLEAQGAEGTSLLAADDVAHELTLDTDGLGDLAATYPRTAGYLALRLADSVTDEQIADLLTGQLLVTQRSDQGFEYVTGVQIAGVLDDVYGAATERDLGATWTDGVPTLSVWAPTAKSVTTLVWADGDITGTPDRVPAQLQDDGSWITAGSADWTGAAYQYDIEVFVPRTGKVENNVVTDPYSVALTVNSTRSVLVDLADPAYQPDLWTGTPAPIIERDVDRSIYELHIRDFSISDETVPADERGTYAAFAGDGDGVKHLRSLARAGLNTVHLLPSFDIATIEEDRSKQKAPVIPDAAPDSQEQQAAVAAAAHEDAFNWGYDPLHYQAPEGSYATTENQNGGARVAEFRTMVGGLHDMGLQVVLDQVFNHTAAHGQSEKSILDRVVPGYYQRLDTAGNVESSTCCSNVATENALAEKLMVDSAVIWARDYRVDGFRFDLMGHHSKANMLAVRAALDELTLADDGVDGKAIYLYGEGWDFGEVEKNALFEQATQGQLGGTGIGTFSDRLRDAVHGGSPVDGGSTFTQGFGTGLGTDPNGREANAGKAGSINSGSADELADLAHQTDLVRLGLAGNLRDFTFETSSGAQQRGDEIDYRGAPAGYADSPEEVVTYVDAHDNETLFDILTLKLPVETSMADRVRMNNLALATTTLSQTPTFWHAGTDLLRSKSLDRDSYNSGDHFNRIDWSGQDNNFGVGLPIEEKNKDKWEIMAPLLANADLKPTASDIAAASTGAQELLQLRYSTDLLRLGSADLIHEKVTFPGSGAEATAGLLLMHVDDTIGADVDPALDGVLVAFNASPDEIVETVPQLAGRALELSQVQADGTDETVRATTWASADGTLTIPGRSVAVLVEATDGSVDPTGPTDPTDPTDPSEPTDSPTDGPGAGDGTGSGDGADGSAEGPDGLPKTGANLLPALLVGLTLVGLGTLLAARLNRQT